MAALSHGPATRVGVTDPAVLARAKSESQAAAQVPNAEVIRVQNGTHLCVWTDPTSADVQDRITAVISGG